MKRRKATKKDRRNFTKQASKTHPRNLPGQGGMTARGGTRLW